MSFNGQTLNAGQPDPNATPTTPAQPAQQPAQPMQNAQPQAQPQQPKPQQPNQSAALNPNTNPVHKSLFDRIFTGLGGGPRYVTTADPQTGQPKTVEVPTSKGDITRSLLAGVIHGMISGYQAGNNTPAGPLGTRSAGIANGLAAGNAAAAANQQQFKNAPQAQYDKQQQQALTATNNVVAELTNQAAIQKLHLDDDESKEKYFTTSQDIWQPQIDAITKASKDLGISLIDDANKGLHPEEVAQKMQGNVGKLMPVQDGWVTKVDPATGRTYHDPTYSLAKIGDIPVGRDAFAALAPWDSKVQEIIDKRRDDVTLGTSQLIDLEKKAQAGLVGYEFLHRMQQGLGVDEKDQTTLAQYQNKFANNYAFQREIAEVGKAVGNVGTASTAHALAQLQASGKTPQLFSMLGKSPDEIQKFTNDKKNDELRAAAEATADIKRKDADRPADPARIQNAPLLIKSSSPYLNKAQVDSYISKLHPTMSNDELDKVQKEASDENDRVFTQRTKLQELEQNKVAKDDTAIAKGEKPVVGVDANGNQVLVPAGDVKKYGLTQVREVGQAENEKVTNARSLMTVFNNSDPDDLGIMQLAQKLDKEGKLGPAASRFQDWLNKSGSVVTNLAGFDAGAPDVQRLFTKLGLSTTGLMQVHVGARGSAQMLEHFEDLAKAKSMSPQAFRAAIDTENSYVRMKAMLPNSGKSAQAQTPTAPAGSDPFAQFGGKTRGQ